MFNAGNLWTLWTQSKLLMKAIPRLCEYSELEKRVDELAEAMKTNESRSQMWPAFEKLFSFDQSDY